MRKTIMSVLLALTCSTMLAENKMTASDVTINAGETAELIINIENDMNVAAFDFRLYLPDGISVVWDESLEDYAWEWCARVPGNARGSFFDMNIQTTDDNSLMFGANSGTSGKVLTGNNGSVLKISLRADESASSGTGELKVISFSNEDGTQSVTPNNVTFNITVNSEESNRITANDVTIKTGENANLTISIENDMNVAAFDFRLYLPDGISVVWDEEYEDYSWDWCERVPKNARGSFFDMNIQTTDDNSLMFGANSGTSGKVLNGNNGPVLTITLHAAASAKSGEGQLKRISFSNEDGTQSVSPNDATFNIIVIPATGINDIEQDGQNAAIYNLAGQRLGNSQFIIHNSKLPQGIYIVGGKKVMVK